MAKKQTPKSKKFTPKGKELKLETRGDIIYKTNSAGDRGVYGLNSKGQFAGNSGKKTNYAKSLKTNKGIATQPFEKRPEYATKTGKRVLDAMKAVSKNKKK